VKAIAAWVGPRRGRTDYPLAKSCCYFVMAAVGNSATIIWFKEDLQSWANRLGIDIRGRPSVTRLTLEGSNPIEQPIFPHLTRACAGVLFYTLETVRYYNMAKAKRGRALKLVK